ncbi:uncharacterized protein [Coffea arabica]|uniref:Integrase zinc-binding domain-containing protein n=1 Tax=Coffea arabica TaxID=13443 RepID=A0ABM4VUC8_COFAR
MLGIDVKAERLPYDLEVRTPTGNQILVANEVYRNCEIWVGERKLVVDLISLTIKGYDVILGMDWLAHYLARVDCRMKVVEFCIPGEATLKLDVRGEKIKLEEMPVINEYLDVFPEELASLALEREIEFKVDLAPGTTPISKIPYRMAPTELKELKVQLQDLLERGFIHESESPWGAPVLFVKKKDGSLRESGVPTPYNSKGWTYCGSGQSGSELATVVFALKKWRHYLYGVTFEHPRKANVVADALSRKAQLGSSMVGEWSLLEDVCEWNPRLEPRKVIFENIEVKSTLLNRLKEGQMKEPMVQKWMEKVKKGELPDFNLGPDGILRFRNRVIVSRDEELKREILEESHRSRYTVHLGSGKMYQDLKSLYWWDNMKAEIAQFVQKCLTCQQVKAEHQKPSGLLQPLEIPEWKWEHITMDFVSGLPRTQKDFGGSWSQYLTLVEFAYNNSYHSSIQMAPYEALYGRKCRSPIYWDEVGERKIIDPATIPWVEETYERVRVIRQRLQTAQSRQRAMPIIGGRIWSLR